MATPRHTSRVAACDHGTGAQKICSGVAIDINRPGRDKQFQPNDTRGHHVRCNPVQDTSAAVPVQSPETDAFALVPFETTDADDEEGPQSSSAGGGAVQGSCRPTGRPRPDEGL